MLPEQRKLIMENQKLLYSFRKRGTDLPKKELNLLAKKMGVSYVTMQKLIKKLEQNNIILDANNFLLNSDFAYFVGFYVTDNSIEVEVLDFQLEPIEVEKIIPEFQNKVSYDNIHDNEIRIIEEMIEKLSEFIPIEAASIVFNKCMSYSKNGNNLAYYESNHNLELCPSSILLNNSRGLMESTVLKNMFIGDDVLTYLLYLREKVFESDSIVYYDLDQNRISYIMNNILRKSSNPVFGMIFPRYTQQQNTLFQKLEKATEKEYANMLIDNKELLLDSVENIYIQIKAILDPEHFVFGGRWLREVEFENFISTNNRIFNKYKNIANTLFVKSSSSSLFNVINRDSQSQKGAGIYAAYSYFNWDLKW